MLSRGTGISGRRSLKALKALEAQLEPVPVRPVLGASRQGDTTAMEALQARAQHRPVDLAQQTARDVDHALRIDAEEVAVEREVMDLAQRQAVDDRRAALGLDVG